MSMITSCPACGTMFRVVPDQLKISEGWVRCGHCTEIFDASAHLSDESILELPPTAQPVARPAAASPRHPELPSRPAELQTEPAELPTRPADLRARPAELQPPEVQPPSASLLKRAEAASRPPPPSPGDERQGSSSEFGLDSHALEPSPLDTPFVFRPSDLLRQDGDDASGLPGDPGQHSRLRHDLEDEDELPPQDLQSVSFVRQARRRAFWRRPAARLVLAFISLLLGAMLLLQVAYHDRDRLALTQPGLRPALERMCNALGCRLGAPRQIEAIVIESSGFNRLREETYRLAFTLRNTARIPVAAPAMELTITDGQDQPIARRVIRPAEIATAGEAIPAEGEWSRAFGLVLAVPGPSRVAGYRLLAFYP